MDRFSSIAGWQGRLETVITAVFLLLIFLAALTYVQFGTDALAGTDGYYHSKMGLLIREQGLTPDFPWLPLTILNAIDFYDHHLLYHAYLAMFTTVDPALDGGVALTQSSKIANIILPALAFLALWWLLRGQEVAWASLWAIGVLAMSSAFLYRMSMPRAQSASVLVLVLGLHWLLTGRFRWLIPLGFVYVWLYNAFPLLLVLGGVVFIATWIQEQRFEWKALIFPALGIGLGLLLNPYFPENISFIINHLLPKIGESTTAVGNEWYPYKTWSLVTNSGPALAAFVLGIGALGWSEQRIDRRTLTALGLVLLFGFMLFKSRRFVEYFPLFALIFMAFSVQSLWRDWLGAEDAGREAPGEKRPFLRYALPLLLAFLILLPLPWVLKDARAALGRSKPADQYAAAALWLRQEAEPGAMVFQTDWDDFPRLFFYNTAVRYTVGLDPTYLEIADPDLFATWESITDGEIDAPSQLIREQFGADYVFSDLTHTRFLTDAERDADLEEIYRDDYAVIFRVED